MADPKTIGLRLKELRGNATIESVAKAIGISCSALGMYESGRRVPRDEIKVKLANYYKCSIEEVFFVA